MKDTILKTAQKGLQGLGIVALSLLGIATQNGNDFEVAKNLELFSNVYKEIHAYYVDDLDPDKVIRVATDAMLKSLDPYTVYIAPEEVAQFHSSISGRYAGLGIAVQVYNEQPMVSEAYENSPAAKAGLKPGDIILSAAGQQLQGKSIKEISNLLRGLAGTEIQIEIKRPGESKPSKLSLKRAEIINPNVPCAKMIGNTAYLVLSGFSENAGKNLSKALQDLRQNHKIESIILDLRGNGGGLLTEAINVANIFLPKNQLVCQTKGRNPEDTQPYYTLNQPLDTATRLTVLVDNNSASAAEIVAGALQDLDRALIVGNRSFGKGLVQNTRELSFGAKLKITTSRYYIPSGRCIQSSNYKDGQPVQIADSLRVKFRTKAGRTVLDGGGISPDVVTIDPELKKLVESLQKQYMIFDFATNYLLKNKTAPAPAAFELPDAEFDNFIEFVKNKGYNFSSETDKQLAELEKKAKEENIYPLLEADIAQLKQQLASKKMAMFVTYRGHLQHLLSREISRRYYFERGSLEVSTSSDPTIQKALELLNDPNQYQKLLSK